MLTLDIFAPIEQSHMFSLTTDPEVPDVSCTNMTGRFAGGQPFMAAVRAQAFTGLTGPIKLQVHILRRVRDGLFNPEIYT